MKTLDPPSPPNQGWENGAFLPFARLHPWFGGDGGLLFHFILSKIVSCQSCLVPQLVPRPHYYSAQPERLGSRGPNEDPGKTPHTWYKPRTSKWRRSRWMEKVSYFLQRFLYGFKSTLQKENAQLKKVLNWPQKRFNTWNVSCGVWETRQFFNISWHKLFVICFFSTSR